MTPGQIIKTFKSKKGNDVIIRYPKWEDLDEATTLANELVKEEAHLMLSEKQTHEDEAKWLAESLVQIEQGKKIQLLVDVNDHYAGNAEIRVRDKRQSHVGEIGIALGKDFRDEGIGAELLTALIAEGKKAGLQLLILYCFQTNEQALHLYKKLGFTRSGIVPGIYAYKGDFVGEVTLYLPLV